MMKGYIKYLLVLIFFNCTNDLGKNLTISGNIKGLREACLKKKIYTMVYSYFAQNIGVKITKSVNISNLPNSIAKANVLLVKEPRLE